MRILYTIDLSDKEKSLLSILKFENKTIKNNISLKDNIKKTYHFTGVVVYLSMKEINSEIEIFSTPEQVWRILTDFDKYPQWNPFIDQISGELKKGSKLTVHVKPEG